MKPLHRTTWRTESDCGVQVDVAEGRTTEWAPFREIVVTMDAGMTPAEARRLIVDLQHAVALAEEFDAPEREDVSTDDQPKPREARRVWVDSQGGIWDGRRDRDVYFRAPEGEAPTWGPWDEINAGEYGPLTEVLADSEERAS